MLWVSNAGCVKRVLLSWSAGPSNEKFLQVKSQNVVCLRINLPYNFMRFIQVASHANIL